MSKLIRGMQVVYVPSHLKETDPIGNHGLQPGFITSGPNANGDYFVRYWGMNEDGLREPLILRTKTNSELTPIDNLVVRDTVPQIDVEIALGMYC